MKSSCLIFDAYGTISSTTYTYNKSYTQYGVPYKDSLKVNMQIYYNTTMPNNGEQDGYAQMSVLSNKSTNLNTGVSCPSWIYIGKGISPKIQVAVNKDMAFINSTPSGVANKTTRLSCSLNWGYSIGLVAGLSFDISLNPGAKSVSFGALTNYSNYPGNNKFIRSYAQSFDKSLYLYYPGDNLRTSFKVSDFSSSKYTFNISSNYIIPFYSLFDEGRKTYTFGLTTPLIPQN